ncbi:Ankycorbin [Morella rubra]|uniref:Ankycorbin n=1 Tax=Morella rubra TaxID=262757 RepID=A0A6A1WGL2_9ROSI|nr:Ankycorbin [Morella rubra]
MDEGAIIPKGVNFIAGTLNEESLRIEMVEKTQAFLDLENETQSQRQSDEIGRIMVTEGIAEEKNLTNPFRFARAELFDVDSETEGKLLKKGKRKIGMPRGGETSVPYPIRSSEITEETSLSTNPIPLPETELSTSPPKAADGEIRDRSSRLCLAAVKGDWETAKSIIENDRNLVRAGLTRERDTVFHIAVTGKCSDFIRKLVEFLEPDEMLTVNINNDTGLHIAAASGMLEVARLIDVEKNRKLLLVRGKDGLIPLALAIRGGHREMVDYLYGCTDLDDPADEEYITLVLDSLSRNLYVTALKLVDRRKTMAYERDKTGKTALHVLAQKAPEVATVGYTLEIIREILYIAALKAVDRRTNRVRPRGSPAYILASALLEILVEILYHLSRVDHVRRAVGFP